MPVALLRMRCGPDALVHGQKGGDKEMDKILSYWAEKEDAFPEAMRMREETGCCAVYGFATPGENGEPPTAAGH